MPILTIYVDEPTIKRLQKIHEETGRPVVDLAESAVAETALVAFRHRKDDPAKT